jgi:hypothetical protein
MWSADDDTLFHASLRHYSLVCKWHPPSVFHNHMKHSPITSLLNSVVKVCLTVAERRSDERAEAEMARAANRLACPQTPLLHAHGQAGKLYQTSRKARGIRA